MGENEMIHAYDRMETDEERGNKIRIMAELNDCDVDYITAVLKDAGRRIPHFIPRNSTGVGRVYACEHRSQIKRLPSDDKCGTCKFFQAVEVGVRGSIYGICLHSEVRKRYGDIKRTGTGKACKRHEKKEVTCSIQKLKS